MSKIIHNRAKCKACGDIIESHSVHDWRACSCGDIFVDGGHDYCRAGAKNFENFIPMYEYSDSVAPYIPPVPEEDEFPTPDDPCNDLYGDQ